MPPQTQTPPAAASPRPHEHDSVAVTNIDINCNESTTFTVERSIPVAPIPGENNPMNIPRHQSQMQEGEFHHNEYFEVRYNSQPFRIAPGETKVFPRYIAEHFAKHLADHILQKKELAEKRQGLVQSNIERPKVLNEILEVRQWFLEGQQIDPNVPVADMPGVPTQDLGAIPNYAVGDLKPEPKSAEQILSEADRVSSSPTVVAPGTGAQVANPAAIDPFPPEQATTAPASPPVDATGQPLGPDSLNSEPTQDGERTKPELIREAVMLGIEVNGRETSDELKQKIATF